MKETFCKHRTSKQNKNCQTQKESEQKPTKKVEEVKVEGDVKVEVVKVEGDEKKAKSESEQIAIEAEKMKTLETLEEDEATMK